MKAASRYFLPCLVAAVSVLAAGCPKRPLHPAPAYQANVGSDAGGLSPGTSLPVDLPGRGGVDARGGTRGVLPNIYFDFDSAAIRAGERAKLSSAVDHMAANPGARLLLEGHCDWRGTEEYNLGLGDRRADAVRQFLTTAGVSPSRLETLSLGDHGAVEGASEAQMQEDRRVEIVVLD